MSLSFVHRVRAALAAGDLDTVLDCLVWWHDERLSFLATLPRRVLRQLCKAAGVKQGKTLADAARNVDKYCAQYDQWAEETLAYAFRNGTATRELVA